MGGNCCENGLEASAAAPSREGSDSTTWLLYSYHLTARIDYGRQYYFVLKRVPNELQVCIVSQFTGVSVVEVKTSVRLH